MQLVSENIQLVMTERGLTAASLARKADVNPTGVYDIISGKSRSPRLDTLSKIAKALGVTLTSLLETPTSTQLSEELKLIYSQLPDREKKRLLQAALSWLPDAESA